MSVLLSRTQKNLIFQGISALDLDPADFEWRERQEGRPPEAHLQLLHRPTEHYLDFSLHSGQGHWLSWAPMFEDGSRFSPAYNWAQVDSVTAHWLRMVKRDHDAPDLWQAAAQSRAWLTDFSDTSNTPFQPSERVEIAARLKALEAFAVKQFDLQKEQARQLTERLDYLAAATERLGRFDWRMLAGSAFVTAILTLGLNPNQAAQFVAQATHLLGPLVAGAVQLLR
jgi:hypothetical protein